MILEEIESFHCLENSVNENYTEKTFPVNFSYTAGLISDEDGPTSIGMALVGAALVIYVFHKHYKKRK